MENDIESHEEYAARISGIPLEEVTPEMRRAAKELRMASMYGARNGGMALVPPTGTDRLQSTCRLFRGNASQSVLVHNFGEQEVAAFAMHAKSVRELVEKGAKILPGSVSSDIMVEVHSL